MLMEESVLHHRIADDQVMAGQPGQLLEGMPLPSISLEIIPSGVPRGPATRSSGPLPEHLLPHPRLPRTSPRVLPLKGDPAMATDLFASARPAWPAVRFPNHAHRALTPIRVTGASSVVISMRRMAAEVAVPFRPLPDCPTNTTRESHLRLVNKSCRRFFSVQTAN
ncbi:Scr1 family TA system antitoxin-like transcriptional regulator [Microtetraspora sp. NBRC 13810]|uniref:Scr1 family TA system antitoxin-like transcriptional regulator n=1 Tax=Microtetraspora sp. NBRC 13810 TaxID=3030990 RepID=UPI003319065B